MKPVSKALGIVVLAIASGAFAQTRPFGIGAIVGDPMGATMKVWFNPYIAVDVAAGAEFAPPSRSPFLYAVPPGFQVHMDLLGHLPLAHTKRFRMPVYIGVGPQSYARYGEWDVRVRTPIGLAFLLPRSPFPWEIFFEFAPTWGRAPRVFDPNACMGFRYYF